MLEKFNMAAKLLRLHPQRPLSRPLSGQKRNKNSFGGILENEALHTDCCPGSPQVLQKV